MKRTVVPMGPQHPVLPEPIVLDLVLEDEKVVDAIPTIGYIHRGLEMLVERVEFTEFGYVVERICGICSFSTIAASSESEMSRRTPPIRLTEKMIRPPVVFSKMSRTCLLYTSDAADE